MPKVILQKKNDTLIKGKELPAGTKIHVSYSKAAELVESGDAKYSGKITTPEKAAQDEKNKKTKGE